jgi:hypothetical protein
MADLVASAPRRPASASLAHLWGRLALVEGRVQRVVERRRSEDPDPNDRFRGLYISDAQVDRLLTGPVESSDPGDEDEGGLRRRIEASGDAAEAQGEDLRLRRLGQSFGLDELDLELLLIVLAPDLDARFERLYAYLNDDVSRRRPTIGLALDLAGFVPATGIERARLAPTGNLVAGGLVVVEEPERPFLTRSLRIPDRVTEHLLGHDTPDLRVRELIARPVRTSLDDGGVLARAIVERMRLIYLRDRPGAASQAIAVAALEAGGVPYVVGDLARLTAADDLADLAPILVREARLAGGALVAGPIDALAERSVAVVRQLAEADCPVIIYGGRTWDPAWSNHVPLTLEAPAARLEQRDRLWRAAFDEGLDALVDAAGETVAFRLTPEQIHRAAVAAIQHARSEGREVQPADLRRGARAQNASGLERLARRIEPRVAWEDLVLPGDVLAQLHEVASRARHRDRVLDDWGMSAKSSKGRGLTGLFAGDSGTGKTMSAEVIAGDLGLDLYVIDLSTVVDKYIGETEKNLDKIFGEADRVNAVLLFDEADALFGKRSEVSDARDRYANVEVAYLLQRMEQFDGVAILTTNLRANLDEAFTRRLDAIVDFPMPEEPDRRRLWERHLSPGLPRAADIDVDFLARSFKLSGGNVRNICVAAAFFAAAEDGPVTMARLIRATEREYQKLGRLTHEAEFGPYFVALATRVTAAQTDGGPG